MLLLLVGAGFVTYTLYKAIRVGSAANWVVKVVVDETTTNVTGGSTIADNWTLSPRSDGDFLAYDVYRQGYLCYNGVSYGEFGARPVITIPKSKIQ